MRILLLPLLFVAFIYAQDDQNLDQNLSAEHMDQNTTVTAEEPMQEAVQEPGTVKEKSKDTFISISRSSREQSAITVSAMAEVEYDNSDYQTIQFSQKIYEDYSIGLVVQVDEEVDEVLGFAGLFSTKDWFYSVEQSKISGRITRDDSTGATIEEFKDNNYLDIKILKMVGSGSEPVSVGFQYLTYERPSVFRVDDKNYIDPKMTVTFIGFGIEMDGVKRKIFANNFKSQNDWYFYNTTFMGFGNIETSDETKFIGNGYTYSSPVAQTPPQTSWSGLGLNGEYELGYVRYQKLGPLDAAFKIGFNVTLEGPAIFNSDDYDFDSEDVNPTEQLLSSGVNFTLMAAF